MEEDGGHRQKKDISTSWSHYLRRQSKKPAARLICPECHKDIPNGSDSEVFNKHAKSVHSQVLASKTTDEERSSWIKNLYEKSKQRASDRDAPLNSPASAQRPASPGERGSQPSSNRPPNRGKADDAEPRSLFREEDDSERSARSGPSSLKREGSRSSSTSPPKRSRGRPTPAPPADDDRAEFDRGALQARAQAKGRLYNPDEDNIPSRTVSYDKANVAANHRIPVATGMQPRPPRQGHQPGSSTTEEVLSSPLIKEPETTAISQEQLVVEVKGIYAGLVMVENKCIEVDGARTAQGSASGNDISHQQWQALIALHRTLLHEHHDFFLATQHPSASPALRRLASKYAMPARMWRHGIHSFLELLRHRLPASFEHMLTFIYLAYSTMALLYETVPAFEDTWIECLGDLGRYRMAIEDDNIRDREVWTAVSRGWYSKASDKSPTTGRLYHHLAILARPNALQQLFYYNKSLCVAIPFVSARDSIMTLFEPIMAPNSNHQSRLPATEHAFVKTHAIMFSKKTTAKLDVDELMKEFIDSLDNYIGRSTRRFLEPGYYMGISNCCAIIGYGNESNPIYNAFKQSRTGEQQDQHMAGSAIDETAIKDLAVALKLANKTFDIILRRFGDPNILSYVHTVLVFIYHSTFYPEAMEHLASGLPWKLLSLMLNTLLRSCQSFPRIESEGFPGSERDEPPRPLPEDYAMRGLLWVDKYYPSGWFSNEKIEDDEKGLEVASMGEERKIRVLYLGCRIARENNWLRYSNETHQFSVSPEFDMELDSAPSVQAEGINYGDLPDASAVVMQ